MERQKLTGNITLINSAIFQLWVWLIASSHREHPQDSLVLSMFAVWSELATSQDCLRLKILKQFGPVFKCGVNWVFSCPDPVSNSQRGYLGYYDVLSENWVKSSSQMRSHRRQDKTVLSPIYWKLSATVANSVHTANTDNTREDSLVLSVSAERTSHKRKKSKHLGKNLLLTVQFVLLTSSANNNTLIT